VNPYRQVWKKIVKALLVRQLSINETVNFSAVQKLTAFVRVADEIKAPKNKSTYSTTCDDVEANR